MNRLMQMLLIRNGYMDEAGADGVADGGAGPAAGATGNEGAGSGQGSNEGAQGEASEGDAGDDNGNKPDDETAKLLKEVMKWKGKAKSSTEELQSLKSQVTELQALRESLGDLKPEQIQEMATQQKEAQRRELEKKGEYDRILEQVKTENSNTVNSLKSQIEELTQQLQSAGSQIEELTTGRQFRDSEFVRTRMTLPPSIAQKEFGDHFEFVDGEFVAYDKPRGAKDRTPLVDGDGNLKPFDAAIEHLVNKHPDSKSLLKSFMKPGAGSGTEKPGATSVKTQQTNQVYGQSRIKAALDSGSK